MGIDISQYVADVEAFFEAEKSKLEDVISKGEQAAELVKALLTLIGPEIDQVEDLEKFVADGKALLADGLSFLAKLLAEVDPAPAADPVPVGLPDPNVPPPEAA